MWVSVLVPIKSETEVRRLSRGTHWNVWKELLEIAYQKMARGQFEVFK